MSLARIQLSIMNDFFPRIEIENRAFGLLEELSPDIGLSTALTVAKLKVDLWEVAKSQMTRQRDPRLVYLATFDTTVLNVLVAPAPSNVAAITRLEGNLLVLLAKLPVDAAALTALIVAEQAARRAGREL